MNKRSAIRIGFLLGLFAVWGFEAIGYAAAGEPLPDASWLAVRGRGRPQKQQQPKVSSDMTLTGVIDNVLPTGLVVKEDKSKRGKGQKDQKEWLVVAQSGSTEFTIRGTATLDYLRKGQTVEFVGRTVPGEDKAKGEKLDGKLKELTIVSRKGGSSLLNKDAAKHHAAAPGLGRIEAPKEDTDLGVNPAEGGDAAPADKKGGKAAKPEPVAAGPQGKLTGRIAAHDEKSITVTVGARTIHIDLVEIPTINVELSDPKLVPDAKDSSKSRIEGKGSNGHLVAITAGELKGAKIVAHGSAVQSKSGNECMANSILVTLATPLTGKKPTSESKKTALDK